MHAAAVLLISPWLYLATSALAEPVSLPLRHTPRSDEHALVKRDAGKTGRVVRL